MARPFWRVRGAIFNAENAEGCWGDWYPFARFYSGVVLLHSDGLFPIPTPISNRTVPFAEAFLTARLSTRPSNFIS